MLWFPAPLTWWAERRETLRRPWSETDARLDCCFWVSQVHLGVGRWPGTRRLAEDWGWTRIRVRYLLKKRDALFGHLPFTVTHDMTCAKPGRH